MSSNITKESVITNVSPLCTRPVSLPLSPSSMVYLGPRATNDRGLSPSRRPPLAVQAPATPPIPMKREQQSPPLFGVQRRATSSQFQFYPFPEDCNRTNPEWEASRITFRKEKERELKGRGLEIIGKCITRYVCLFPLVPSLNDWNIVFYLSGDGISIQW